MNFAVAVTAQYNTFPNLSHKVGPLGMIPEVVPDLEILFRRIEMMELQTDRLVLPAQRTPVRSLNGVNALSQFLDDPLVPPINCLFVFLRILAIVPSRSLPAARPARRFGEPAG